VLEQTQQPIYSQSDRQLQNEIATAILTGRVVEKLPEWAEQGLHIEGRQGAADELSQRMTDAGKGMYYHAQSVCHALENGKDTALPLEKWQLCKSQYQRLANSYVMRQRIEENVMRHGSATYFIDNGIKQFFTLDLMQGENGKLEVLNGLTLEKISGFEAGTQAWRDLALWAGSFGREGSGRPQAVHMGVWRKKDGSLELRSHIAQKYPALPRALHCIGLTLRSRLDETPLGSFNRRAGDILEWALNAQNDLQLEMELETLKVLDAAGEGNYGKPRARPKKLEESPTFPQPI